MPAAIVKTKSGKQFRCLEFGWLIRESRNTGGKRLRVHTVTTPSGEVLIIAPRGYATAEVISYEE